MKTNTFKHSGLALMAILVASFTSYKVEIDSFYGNDNNDTGYYNRSADLCSRTWISFYRGMDGSYRRQELGFFLSRTEVDYIRVEHPDGTVEQYEYNFRWSWENHAQTSVRTSYEPNDVSHLDNAYTGGNRLDGYLGGRDNSVEFQGRR